MRIMASTIILALPLCFFACKKPSSAGAAGTADSASAAASASAAPTDTASAAASQAPLPSLSASARPIPTLTAIPTNKPPTAEPQECKQARTLKAIGRPQSEWQALANACTSKGGKL